MATLTNELTNFSKHAATLAGGDFLDTESYRPREGHMLSVDGLPSSVTDFLWRFCNNLDPKRDHFYGRENKNILGLDGTRKTKSLDSFERPWPNIIASDATYR